MKILVSGASGFIGRWLVPVLRSQGYEVSLLVRRPAASPAEISWNPGVPPQVRDFDAVIHLAGETIMGRWTQEKKNRIRESRIVATRNLSLAVAEMRARTFLVASAIGYYGARGDEILTEDSPPGSDFLAQVARDWEAATEPARQAGVRVINFRHGVVLSPKGGALKTMLLPFRLGLGGRIGSGKQWMSWVALDDVAGAMLFALQQESLAGAVNLVAPNPVTNREFTRALGQALHRPVLFPVPAVVVKAILGEMGETLLLTGQRVIPTKLQASGYTFCHTEILETLQTMLS
jgi:uncharacterized protein (TIGR01777 family)